MSRALLLIFAALFVPALSQPLAADDAKPAADVAKTTGAKPTEAKPADGTKPAGDTHQLRYKFRSGETLRTKITHTSAIHTSIKGSQESALSNAVSVKVWKVASVEPSGKTSFQYSLESIAMRGKVGDQAEVAFDSQKDTVVPEMYKQVARTVGVPISVITVDARGRLLDRKDVLDRAFANVAAGQVTIVLPAEPVAVGHVWHEDLPIPVLLDGAGGQKVTRKINARQRYKLESVEGGVATINVATQVLDPALAPAIEVQLLQRVSQGEIKFDLARGRITHQRMAVDRSVVDFHGAGSLMKCKIEFHEDLLEEPAETAARPKSGPAGPKPPTLKR